jgi:UDP-N-acetylglucosamine acyltransferase
VLREAYRLLCRTNLNVKQACEAIRNELPSNAQTAHLLAFIECSKRGIVR